MEYFEEFGKWGTIDLIDDLTIENLEAIVKSEHEIILVYDVSFHTQTYFDHEYYDNGEENCFIKIVGYMKHNKFLLMKRSLWEKRLDSEHLNFFELICCTIVCRDCGIANFR